VPVADDAEEIMSVLDRVNARIAATRGGQPADVAPIVASHQAAIPLAYSSQMILPDQATLAAFMAARMGDVNGLKLTQG
jgi:hypothetical protein